MPASVKKRYFELIRQGMKGAAAARIVGVSTSCGSVWFLDAGGVLIPDSGPISPRFLTQDDRIAIADGLHAGQPIKDIAAAIGKSVQTVYREIKRNSKPDGRYQPWWAHNQAQSRRKRPKPTKMRDNDGLRKIVCDKLGEGWSPQQIARYLARSFRDDTLMRVCAETIYESPWVLWRLELLDFDQGLVAPLCIVERGFELCGRDVVKVAVPVFLWGSGLELMQISRVCAGPAAVR